MAASQLPTTFPLTFTMVAGGPSVYNDVYGITWDNGVHGWVYGQNFILARARRRRRQRFAAPRLARARARARAAGDAQRWRDVDVGDAQRPGYRVRRRGADQVVLQRADDALGGAFVPLRSTTLVHALTSACACVRVPTE